MQKEIFVENETIANKVTSRLRDDIISKKIGIGSRITIKDISGMYGVSETPVREAFRTLEGENLLEIQPYKGATVLCVDETFVRETYEILGALECLIYETALDNLDDALLGRMREINGQIRRLTEDGDPHGYTDLNTLFHNEAMRLGNNKKAYDYYQYLHKLIYTLRRNYCPDAARICAAADQHEELIEALAAKDPARIHTVTCRHLHDACCNLLEIMNVVETK